MKINRNMSAVATNTQLLRTENRLQASIAKLSSGYKINSAGDNPAGMAISNKMRAQIDALKQANANANDGISVVQIADGALNEVTSMIQRLRELSVQAANGTNTYEDKQSIQTEIEQLKKEIDRISGDTEYNTKALLDGSSDIRTYADGASRVNISDNVASGIYSVEVTAAATQATATYTVPNPLPEGSVKVNGMEVEVTGGMTTDEFMHKFADAASKSGAQAEINGNEITITSNLYGTKSEVNVTFSKDLYAAFGGATTDEEYYTDENFGENATVVLGAGYGENATSIVDGNRVYVRDNNGFSMDYLLDAGKVGQVDVEISEIGTMKIQVGSNQYQEMDVRIPEISCESLYIDTIDVTTYGGATRALDVLDSALSQLSEVRSRLGAFQNRLEYANNSLNETHEDMTAAYSRIMDTDMAEEMTEYSQLNILDQATISVLAQANDLPQQVLTLLAK